MSARTVKRVAPGAPRSLQGYSDATRERIWAYLASVRPLRGVMDLVPDDTYRRGRDAIERLAHSAPEVGSEDECDGAALRLSAAECADVAAFMARSEPWNPRTWWDDPNDAPSHVCGLQFVLYVIADSLREAQP